MIVGLGNPGPEYETTRHNAGFWLADQLADDLHATFNLEKSFFSWVAKARFEGENVIIAKPITFMNKSGQAAGALMRFYKLKPEQVLSVRGVAAEFGVSLTPVREAIQLILASAPLAGSNAPSAPHPPRPPPPGARRRRRAAA